MRIIEAYSHLNGEEFLLIHRKRMYKEIVNVIENVNAHDHRTKVSKEKTMPGSMLFSPIAINRTFKKQFRQRKWNESRYRYYVTTDRNLMQTIMNLPLQKQKETLKQHNKEPIFSYNQTDFVKDKVAVEVQFGKYAFVAYDLFVKHLLFYTGGVIDVGIEILPMKEMQKQMSSGVAYYEGEVYNIMRQGRTSPPVPLLIIGIAP